jgi:hypothetical protein
MNQPMTEAKQLTVTSEKPAVVRCILGLLDAAERAIDKCRERIMKAGQPQVEPHWLMKWDLSEE